MSDQRTNFPMAQSGTSSRSRGTIRGPRLAGLIAAVALGLGLMLGMIGRDLSVNGSMAAPVAAQASTTDIEQALVSTAERVGPAVVSVRTDSGLGSGVIYDSSGLILTNAHVVDGARSIAIRLADGRQLDGRMLGADAGFDLAVIKVDASGLPAASLGSSSTLKVGQMVMAIGNPYGFDHTVTTGVVSALNRPIAEGQQSYAQPMIQTNADINPGNSGGPLVDLQGNVIGITTLVAAPQGFPAQGLGFAVPVDTAGRIAPQLARDGRVTRSGQPYLGVSVGDAGSATRSTPGGRSGSAQSRVLPGDQAHGALLQRVDPSGPAGQSGLKDGDIVTQFGGKEIYGADDFLQNLVIQHPGNQVEMVVNRGNQSVTLSVVVGEAPAR